MTAWLSVDTDDEIHLPSQRGHPYRSSKSMATWRTEGYRASPRLLDATDRFIEWVEGGPKVTLFLIAEQLDCPEFTQRLDQLLVMPNILFACHGWGHRCWSAWPEDVTGFSEMLVAASPFMLDLRGVHGFERLEDMWHLGWPVRWLPPVSVWIPPLIPLDGSTGKWAVIGIE